jgi:hypothetical protein
MRVCACVYIYIERERENYMLLVMSQTGSLQALGLPAANPAYPLTCSNPLEGFKLCTFQNNKP